MWAVAKRTLKGAVEAVTRPLGVKISRRGHDWEDTSQFIPLEATLKAAHDAQMSVGDYIDAVMNGIPRATQATIAQMNAMGVFKQPMASVVEIGPGSGRYLALTLIEAKPARYEIYETAASWAAYLTKTYGVISQPTDGKTLSATADQSAELVHAHKVFNSVDFLTSMRYWREMARITKPGGCVVFDLMTERCLENAASIDRWIDSGLHTGAYPAVVPGKLAIDYFTANGFECVGTFFSPLTYGRTEVFVFRRGA